MNDEAGVVERIIEAIRARDFNTAISVLVVSGAVQAAARLQQANLALPGLGAFDPDDPVAWATAANAALQVDVNSADAEAERGITDAITLLTAATSLKALLDEAPTRARNRLAEAAFLGGYLAQSSFSVTAETQGIWRHATAGRDRHAKDQKGAARSAEVRKAWETAAIQKAAEYRRLDPEISNRGIVRQLLRSGLPDLPGQEHLEKVCVPEWTRQGLIARKRRP